MNNTIIQQGSFVSNQNNQFLQIRSGVDWIETYNYTQALAVQIAPVGVKFYWQKGMPAGSAFETTKGVLGAAGEFVVATGGFTPLDTTVTPMGTLYTDITAVSNAAIPVVTSALATAANGLTPGDVVRLTNVVGGRQISGMDFTIGYSTPVPGNPIAGTFSLEYMPQMVAATTGNWQKVNNGSFGAPFYPARRFITAVSQAAQAVIRLSVRHRYVVGQKVRVSIPAAYGMTLPPTIATIVAVNTATASTGNTITVDIDTTGLAPFVFPLTAVAAVGMNFAQVVPVGEDTSQALLSGTNILSDATVNDSSYGILLAGGTVDTPAGMNNDVIYWRAGTSFNV